MKSRVAVELGLDEEPAEPVPDEETTVTVSRAEVAASAVTASREEVAGSGVTVSREEEVTADNVLPDSFFFLCVAGFSG